MDNSNSRLDFANSLRGIACVIVLIAHYVMVFDYVKGEYAGFPALPISPYPHWFPAALNVLGLNWGAFGVAVFFLISGIVIPNSITSFSGSAFGRLGFILNRVFRLYPTYAVGLALTVLAIYVSAHHAHGHLDYALEDVALNASFFRDWSSAAPIGGVVWSLEVEAKFYLFILVFWNPLSRGRVYPMVLVALAALAVIPLHSQAPTGWTPPANFVWFFKYLTFMAAGMLFNLHYRGKLPTEKLFIGSLLLVGIFVYASAMEGFPIEFYLAYLAAYALFATLYLFIPAWTGGRVVRFLADISYPLYAMHASFGYVGMRLMLERGVPIFGALVIQTALSISIAWVIHRAIELPTHLIGKKISGLVARRKPTDTAQAAASA